MLHALAPFHPIVKLIKQLKNFTPYKKDTVHFFCLQGAEFIKVHLVHLNKFGEFYSCVVQMQTATFNKPGTFW